jgi:hypothetical protein
MENMTILVLGGAFSDFPRGLEAVHNGHGNVEHHQVGVQLDRFFHRRQAVFGLAAYFPLLIPIQQIFEAGAYHLEIVCQQYSHSASTSRRV